jgi:uncharacterized protein YdiU (UPF0061 family)
MMLRKLGLTAELPDDESLLLDLLNWMENNQADYTNTFRILTAMNRTATPRHENTEFQSWLEQWTRRRAHPAENATVSQQLMQQSNPAVIPRNHHVEHALKEAEAGNTVPLMNLLTALQDPYTERAELIPYQAPPPPTERIYQTFCGT